MTHDHDTIIGYLRTLFQPGDVCEVRVLDATCSTYRRPHVESGYFDCEHLASVPKALDKLTDYVGAYVTVNPVNPNLLARAANRLAPAKRNETTHNGDVVARRWWVIDVDPARPTGICATDAEKAAAYKVAQEVRDGLTSMGFPAPMVMDSGNGYYLLYRVDLPADDGGLLHRCLQALQPAATAEVHIDQAVHNAARIFRLPGTWNCKGDSVADRPHRQAKLIEVPAAPEVVPRELLDALVPPAPPAAPTAPTGTTPPPDTDRPGDDFNQSGKIVHILEAHGWNPLHETENNQYWRRPGKTDGQSASFDGTTFYVFSSNAQPFEANTGYTPFSVYAHLEHNGDFAAASQALRDQGFGQQTVNQYPDVDFSGMLAPASAPTPPAKAPAAAAPGPMPDHLLHVPGFLSEYVEHLQRSAPYPNRPLNFAGGLALLSYLAGRRFRDPSGVRPNVFVVGLGLSCSGKDAARKLNKAVCTTVDRETQGNQLGRGLAEQIASAEALEDALAAEPAMLLQTDELSSILQAMSADRDGRWMRLATGLLTAYTSSDSSLTCRRRAGQAEATVVEYPYVTMLGTAIPSHYYGALTESMVTSGLLGRSLIFEASPRGRGQAAQPLDDVPEDLLQAAFDYLQPPGQSRFAALAGLQTYTVPMDDEGTDAIRAVQEAADDAYGESESTGDNIRAAITGRMVEHTRKLALLYALSANSTQPVIGGEAVAWASAVVEHQAAQITYQIDHHLADDDDERDALAVLRHLEKGALARSVLLKKSRLSAKRFGEVITTLTERGDVVSGMGESTGGRTPMLYWKA